MLMMSVRCGQLSSALFITRDADPMAASSLPTTSSTKGIFGMEDYVVHQRDLVGSGWSGETHTGPPNSDDDTIGEEFSAQLEDHSDTT